MNYKIFGQRLNSALAARDMKQKELAETIGVLPNTVSYFCNGARIPNLPQLAAIASALDVSTDYLLGLSEEMLPSLDAQGLARVTRLSTKALQRLTDGEFSGIRRKAIDAILSADALDGFLETIFAAMLDIDRARGDIDNTDVDNPFIYHKAAMLAIKSVKAARADMVEAAFALCRELADDEALWERYKEKRKPLLELEAESERKEDF